MLHFACATSQNQKAMHAGPGCNHVPHEPFADVRLADRPARATRRQITTRATQILHDRVMDRPARVIEEHVDAQRAGVLHRSSKVAFVSVIVRRIETDFAAPLKFLIVSGDSDRAASGQFGYLAHRSGSR